MSVARLRVAASVAWLSAATIAGGQANPVTAAADPVAIRISAADLQEYVGRYESSDNPDAAVAVYLRNGQLTIDGERVFPMPLQGEARDRFFSPGTPTRTVFARDSNGRITTMSLTAARGPATPVGYTRVSADATPLNHGRKYVRTEAMIPVRDGARLHVVIVRPENSETTGKPLPILLDRTPYGADATNVSVNSSKPELAASGYIFVYGDVRGRYKSEGQFVMTRPVVHTLGNHSDPKLVDESSDAYDTVDWLVKSLPNNNGRVGVYGISYPGFLAIMAGVDHHPAVKAISPQAPMTDVWMGDDFFHNGALRQTYAFDYSQQLERGKSDQTVSMTGDTFDFFLKNVSFAGAAEAANSSQLPTTKHIIEEPEYAPSWRAMAVQRRLNKPEVPILETGGFFDQEDMWGTQAEYMALRAHQDASDPQHRVFLALGPWNHGGWVGSGRSLGALNFGEPTGAEYRKSVEAPFFEHYLKDAAGVSLADTTSFRTGVNKWQHYEVWPPVMGFAPAKLYLGANGTLGFASPSSSAATPVSYISDPAHPIPYRRQPIQSTYGQGSKWRTWLADDQKFLNSRKDIARFYTGALDRDTTITGDVVADIFATTTGSDGDFVVKLIDEYPASAPEGMAGYQVMVVDEIFRGRYRKSFEKPEPIAAGVVQEYRWSLHAADHTFLKGHKMLVTVQSTWFPLYDRNPQTFVPKITTAPAAAYQPATISIETSAKYPSHLEVLRPEAEVNKTVAAR